MQTYVTVLLKQYAWYNFGYPVFTKDMNAAAWSPLEEYWVDKIWNVHTI